MSLDGFDPISRAGPVSAPSKGGGLGGALRGAKARLRAAFTPDPLRGMDPRLARDFGVEPRPEPTTPLYLPGRLQ